MLPAMCRAFGVTLQLCAHLFCSPPRCPCSQLWQRFPTAIDYNALWGPFLEAVLPIMHRLKPEAAADK